MEIDGRDIEINEMHASLEGKGSAADLMSLEFFKRTSWLDDMCEILFHIRARDSTIRGEIYFGFVHFVSCLYVLAVIPQQLVNAGYSSRMSVVSTALCCGVGSFIGGFLMNLPLIIAPPTVVSIYLVVFLREKSLGPEFGNAAVILSGFALIFFGYKPLAHFVGTLIPLPIQVGTTVGIGLLTAFAGATEIDLIKTGGAYQLLKKGQLSVEQLISISGLVMISVAIHYRIKAAFCLGLIFCTLAWWIYSDDWPKAIGARPSFYLTGLGGFNSNITHYLTFDLIFLYILYLSGISTSMSNLAGLTRDNGEIPRGRWIFITCGLLTMLSGLLNGPPILISPESAAGIKAGAKTGLSTVVCGCLFFISMFMSPLFEQVPHSGTSPVLLMIGTLLFQNVNRIDWSDVKDAAPAFCVLFFIPFMYSVVEGVLMGYYVYLLIGLCTGDLAHNFAELLKFYFPFTTSVISSWQQYGYFLKSRKYDEENRTGFKIVPVVLRDNTSRTRSMSNSGPRSTMQSEKNDNSISVRRLSESPPYDPTRKYGGVFDPTISATLADIEEDTEDLKAIRSVQFAVFD